MDDNESPSRDQQLTALKRIDEMSEKLAKEKKSMEALQCMEKSLILRGHIFGLDSDEVYIACKSTAEMCNLLAMMYLQQDEFDVTLELLKKAEVLSERHKIARAATYNNMGCYFRKRGKHRTALSYVRKALKIESKLSQTARSADTHLNMCTVLSELQRHSQAIVHARTALKLLLLELFGPQGYANQMPKEDEGDEGDEGEEKRDSQMEPPKLPAERVAVLAIAYHNLAVQQECLRMYKASLASYEKACKVVTTHLGEDHVLVKNLSTSYEEAKVKLTEQIARKEEIAMRSNIKAAKGGRINQKQVRPPPLTKKELKLLSNFNGLDLTQEPEETSDDQENKQEDGQQQQ